jgi:hypothetical protein
MSARGGNPESGKIAKSFFIFFSDLDWVFLDSVLPDKVRLADEVRLPFSLIEKWQT